VKPAVEVRLSGSADDVRGVLERMACDLGDEEYMAGTQLRELAVALAVRSDLSVSVISYDDRQELQVCLVGDASGENVITLDRSKIGDECALALDRWFSIGDQLSRKRAVRLVRALLNANVTHKPAIGVE
jgi:hypothetical protein